MINTEFILLFCYDIKVCIKYSIHDTGCQKFTLGLFGLNIAIYIIYIKIISLTFLQNPTKQVYCILKLIHTRGGSGG